MAALSSHVEVVFLGLLFAFALLCVVHWHLWDRLRLNARSGGVARAYLWALGALCFWLAVLFPYGWALALTTAALPPLALLIDMWLLSGFPELASAMALAFLAVGSGAGLVLHRIVPLREFAFAGAIFLAVPAAFLYGDLRTRAEMCAGAIALGVDEVERIPLWRSLRINRGGHPKFDLHGEVRVDGQQMGWSYSEMDWYRVPEYTFADVHPSSVNLVCGADPQ